jgi:hypothetical protein
LSIISFVVRVDLVCLVVYASLLVASIVSALGVAVAFALIVLSTSIFSVCIAVSISVLISLPMVVAIAGSASWVMTVASTLMTVRVSVILTNVMAFNAALAAISLLTAIMSLA